MSHRDTFLTNCLLESIEDENYRFVVENKLLLFNKQIYLFRAEML